MKKNELIEELKRIGIHEGMALEVHSSLGSFGYIEGGAETVIEALTECVGDNGSIFAPGKEVCKKYPPDEWFIENGSPPVKPWYTIQDMAYERGIIQEGYIGKCKYMFFNIWDVVNLYKKELEKNPYKLYGLD